ncbi:MAG: chaperone modulator CbpM [Arachidicoccus sp.]|nr:chaperone modulator CbpM [Arachidicoccus sp.]
MDNQHLIPIHHICTHYHAEISFFNALQDYGLLEFTEREEDKYITEDQIKDIEQMIHLHYDLDINIEGIDAIRHLIYRINNMHEKITELKKRLSRYE